MNFRFGFQFMVKMPTPRWSNPPPVKCIRKVYLNSHAIAPMQGRSGPAGAMVLPKAAVCAHTQVYTLDFV
jgi:hypothetical protein